MTIVSPLAVMIVRASSGHVVSLPYSDRTAMQAATREAERAGLITSGYDDDQPTSWTTAAGDAFLASLTPPLHRAVTAARDLPTTTRP
jgi:hypothetical protein